MFFYIPLPFPKNSKTQLNPIHHIKDSSTIWTRVKVTNMGNFDHPTFNRESLLGIVPAHIMFHSFLPVSAPFPSFNLTNHLPPTNPRIQEHRSILLSALQRGELVDPDPHSLGHVAVHWWGPTNRVEQRCVLRVRVEVGWPVFVVLFCSCLW